MMIFPRRALQSETSVYAAARKRVNVPNAPVRKRGGKPKLGQHFLRDEQAVAKIIDALGDISQRTVLEIGPGPGTMTRVLAQRARRVIAVELDRVLAAQLSMNLAAATNVEVIEADILSIDFDTLFAPRPGWARPGLNTVPERVHVVGNLPYYITSDILLHLFDASQYFERVVIMVQKEVADRLAAKPGSRDYGLLTDTAQLHARVEKLFDLPPGAFSPPPKVHSSVVRLTMEKKADRLGVPEAEFTAFLKLAFGQKRKTLWNNLKGRYADALLRKALTSTEILPSVRAEALSLDRKAALFRALRDGRG
jgi:16S rRNA (adenine1518-N6/adenine1519-N6)-dimethyltransferase